MLCEKLPNKLYNISHKLSSDYLAPLIAINNFLTVAHNAHYGFGYDEEDQVQGKQHQEGEIDVLGDCRYVKEQGVIEDEGFG